MPTTPSQRIGANVRAEMARSGVSQADLGVAIGVTQAGVSMRLRGRVPFDVNEIDAAAQFLSVPLSRLYTDVMDGSAA